MHFMILSRNLQNWRHKLPTTMLVIYKTNSVYVYSNNLEKCILCVCLETFKIGAINCIQPCLLFTKQTQYMSIQIMLKNAFYGFILETNRSDIINQIQPFLSFTKQTQYMSIQIMLKNAFYVFVSKPTEVISLIKYSNSCHLQIKLSICLSK